MVLDPFEHPILATCVLFIGVVVAVGVISYPLAHYSCTQEANALHLSHNYGFWSGCKVQQRDGAWVDIDNYHGVNVENR